jgi:hypothetical protein
MALKLAKALELIFQKNWSKLALILFRFFFRFSFTSNAQRTFVEVFSAFLLYFWRSKIICSALQFALPWHKNRTIWLRNEQRIW